MVFAIVHEPISLTNVERSLYGIGADRDVENREDDDGFGD
jgi:hypothetical protein